MRIVGKEGSERATVNVSCLFQMRKNNSPFLQVIRRHLLMEHPEKNEKFLSLLPLGAKRQ